jgi:hypothetical protein
MTEERRCELDVRGRAQIAQSFRERRGLSQPPERTAASKVLEERPVVAVAEHMKTSQPRGFKIWVLVGEADRCASLVSLLLAGGERGLGERTEGRRQVSRPGSTAPELHGD